MSGVDVWTLGGAGTWSVAANWSLSRPPRRGDSVDIESGSPFAVTYDGPGIVIGGLTLSGVTLDLQSGPILAEGAASFQNAVVDGAKSLTLTGASTVEGLTLGGSAMIVNHGVATQSGTATAVGDVAASTSVIKNVAGASWIITDDSGMTQGSSSGWAFVNSGLFQKTSGSGVALIKASFYSTGTIASAAGGDIEFDGKTTYLTGTYIGAGMVDYGPDGVAKIGNVSVTASSCQTNFGFVDLVGTMTMNDGSTLVDASGAVWNFDGDGSLALASGQSAGPDINGAGLVEKTAGAGVSTVSVDAFLTGNIYVGTGTLAFSGASSTFSGAIKGKGVFEIAGGQAEFDPGASLAVADWTLSGGNTMFTQSLTYKGVFSGEAGATVTLQNYQFLTFSGPPTINHQVELSGLALLGAGYVQLHADTDISAATIGGTVQVDDLFVVNQTGNIALGDASASDAAYLNIVDGGVWSLIGSASISVGADTRSGINIGLSSGGDNAEVLTKAGTGVSVVAPNVVNECSNIPSGSGFEPRGVDVTGGTLDFKGFVQGTGTDTILSDISGNQPTLEFDGVVGAGQTVVFAGSQGGALDLTDLPAFAAAIDGFQNGDSILIGGGYAFAGASETTTAATLSFTLGSATDTLTLTGDYQGGSFFAQPQTGGVLKITF